MSGSFSSCSLILFLICLGIQSSSSARTYVFKTKNIFNPWNPDELLSYFQNKRRNTNREHIQAKSSPSHHNLIKYKKEYKNKGFLTDLLSNSLDILPSLIPGVVQQVRTVINQPEIIPSLARTITKHVMGSTRNGDSRISSTGKEIFKPTPVLIEDAGFHAESHHVLTPDGYILTMHRIINPDLPSVQSRPVVFLQHGILCSSSDWVIGHRSKAFGFLLSDAGYDVWLGNFRGNIYSRNHTHLDPDKEDFWQFSWDEMGQFDLPTMLFHVTRHTRQDKLVYVGHSMGTTAFWVMMNRYPEMNSMIQLMVGMAPVAVAAHMYSPIKYIAPVAGPVERVLSMTGQYEFWPRGSLFAEVDGRVRRNESVCAITENIIFLIAGFDAPQMNL